MAEMTVQDLAALQDLTKDKHSGKWSENTALWAIVIVLIIIVSIPKVIWDAFKGIGDEFKEKTYYC